MKVLVIKDEEGILRPQAGIWVDAGGVFAQAVKEEWETNLSQKKHFKGCSLVEAELTESLRPTKS